MYPQNQEFFIYSAIEKKYFSSTPMFMRILVDI